LCGSEGVRSSSLFLAFVALALTMRDPRASLNSAVDVVCFPVALSADNAEDLVRGCVLLLLLRGARRVADHTGCRFDVVLDCTDNVATRYLLNDACVLQRRPLVSGSALRFDGQVCAVQLGGVV
jgi:molybdopterin/thiamine biosynthesis adenylyltransferase